METRVTIYEVLNKIGHIVEFYRNKENLTQEQLAKRINVSRLTILNIEKGKGSNTSNVLKLLKYFDLLHDLNVSFDSMLEKATDNDGLSEINLYE